MANCLFGWPVYSDVGVTYSPSLSGGSWLAALPLANLQDRRLAKVARSTNDAQASTMFEVDLGVARAVRLVGLPVHNLSTAAKWRVRGFASAPIWEDYDISDWTETGTGVITGSQADPLGGTRATLLDDDQATQEFVSSGDLGFTGDGTKGCAVVLKAGTAAVTDVSIRDTTAGTNRVIVRATWSGGVPTIAVEAGNGTVRAVVALGDGFYAIEFNVDSVVAANTNIVRIHPAGQPPSLTGSVVVCDVLVWDETTEPVLYDSGALDAWPTGIDAEESEEMNVGSLLTFAAVTARHWRIEIGDDANPDTYVELGRVVIAGAWQPTVNLIGRGGKIGLGTDTVRRVTDGGAAIYARRPTKRRFTGTLGEMPEDEVLANLFDMQRIAGIDRQFYFVYDPDDTTHLHRRAFLAVFRQLSEFEYATLNHYGIPIALIEEL